jgi:hypothetical protein
MSSQLLLITPIKLTTWLSGSGRGAGIRSFVICLNITSTAHPEHGSRRPGRYSIRVGQLTRYFQWLLSVRPIMCCVLWSEMQMALTRLTFSLLTLSLRTTNLCRKYGTETPPSNS